MRLVVPWPPGGSTDTVARIIQPGLQQALGKPVVIENRGGASGSIGAIEASRAAPDGYTWMIAFDTEATNQTTMRLPYRTMQAFAPVTLIATGPLVLAAHPSTPWRSLAALIAAAKNAPDTISFGSAGIGTLAHVATTLLQQQGEFKLTHVPYRGGGPATQAAVAGEVPLYMGTTAGAIQHIRAGTLRPLAVTSETESRHLPGTKAFAQQGFPDFEAPTWWLLLGRAGTPEPVLRQMHEAMTKVLGAQEVREKIEQTGADVVAGGAERCRRFLNAEITKWGRVIRDNNITADS